MLMRNFRRRSKDTTVGASPVRSGDDGRRAASVRDLVNPGQQAARQSA
ncbi:hypothetical protein [Azotobacter salinestris]